MPVVALIGNPNCGKTTLFNALTGANQFVGNWPGVTVEKKEGTLRGRKDVRVLDLPGIYSLAPYSPEEIVARDALAGNTPPDAVLNIVDGTQLERSLYLTLQLLELRLPVVVAVNCADVLRRRGDRFSPETLSRALGCPVVEISALRGEGLGKLVGVLQDACRSGILATRAHNANATRAHNATASGGKNAAPTDERRIAEKYDRIETIIEQCLVKSPKKELSQRLDDVFLNRWLALPIFALVMFLVYYVSVSGIGAWAARGLEGALDMAGRALESLLLQWQAAPWLRALSIDGLWAGVGTLLGFVPQMLLLFGCLSFLEGCGYLARIAFVLDSLLRRFGLSGKCFMPMLLATGCGVPAILACRAIDCPHERRVTAISCTFMPCSAKLPVIALIAGVLFNGAWWMAPLAYFLGFGAVVLTAWLSKLFLQSKKSAPPQAAFVLELPDYRLPSLPSLLRSVWTRTISFLKKAGSVILLSAMAVWFLSSVKWESGRFAFAESLSNGLLADFGRALEPLFRPLGFGKWQAVVATATAFIAKENAVATLGILYNGSIASGFTPVSSLSFLIFNLLCAPCVAAVSALRRELGSTKRTLAAVAWQCALAYGVAFLVYTAGGWVVR
ncbi:MAG: ferrous iron transport protein B [Oscillospiraceae bacterium]|nr:ferrous iron transport protein B [Oscillospiraceae bacterium]